MRILNGAVEGQLLFKERGISGAWRSGHVSKLYVKTLFISENFHSSFRSFLCRLCIVRNSNILHSQDVVLGHFGKTEVYAGHCFIIHLPEVDIVH